jgi:hypothetical protein
MNIFNILVALIPWWPLKRLILHTFYAYKIHPEAYIGFAYVYPQKLYMARGASIGHGTVCKGLSMLWMGDHSIIGRLNWISAIPKGCSTFFSGQLRRDPRLVLGAHSAITNRHLIDCSDRIVVGPYSTIAGFSTQLLTHSVDYNISRQVVGPIFISRYCFIGTRSILLPGTSIPSCTVIAAGAVVSEPLNQSFSLYGGVPARFIKLLRTDALYFTRSTGYIL